MISVAKIIVDDWRETKKTWNTIVSLLKAVNGGLVLEDCCSPLQMQSAHVIWLDLTKNNTSENLHSQLGPFLRKLAGDIRVLVSLA